MKIRSLGTVVTLLICLAALLTACRPIQRELSAEQPPIAQGQHDTAHAAAATVAPTDPPELQIANAMAAAPHVVAEDATVIGFPTEEGGDMVVLRQGTNGWTCLVDWPTSPGSDPSCNDPVFSAWNDAYFAGAEPVVTAPGLGFMLAGGSDPSNTDPMAMAPAAGEEWIATPPHVMIIVPSDLDSNLITTDHHSGYPYIMWEGTPYEHVMMPLVPAVSPSNGPLAADASPEEQILNMRSAAPAVVVDNATLMGYPTEEGGDMVVLQEGTNGWICYPDRLVSPGNDPDCNDAIFEEALTAGTTRAVTHLGLGYMLAGGSDESNTDPLATGPAEGEEWITTPPHVMLVAPGGFDAANFTTDHASGFPYIMWDDTDYEHLMIPVADMPAMAELPASAASAAVDITPEVVAGIQRAEEFIDTAHASGLFNGAALIAQDGEIIWSTTKGMADREQEIPNTLQTVFRINEMTMQFTAAALLLLEQEGKLSMDDPICNYLDECPEAWQPVTIHHLLSHTSGIPDYFVLDESATYRLANNGATPEAIVALFHDQPLQFEPGARRQWGRSGFVLAGQIIERVSGQSYGEFVEQRIMQPLGMAHSGYGDAAQGLAVGYMSSIAKTPSSLVFGPASLYASGGIYSTAEDLFRWNEGLYNGHLLNETQLQKMLTAHATTEFNQGSGYGIVVDEIYGRRRAGNAGRLDGYSAVIARYLDDRVTTVVIGNQEMDDFWLSDEMARRFFGAE
jgi:CubicO group peptidase (beta-lactamase class C family)